MQGERKGVGRMTGRWREVLVDASRHSGVGRRGGGAQEERVSEEGWSGGWARAAVGVGDGAGDGRGASAAG